MVSVVNRRIVCFFSVVLLQCCYSVVTVLSQCCYGVVTVLSQCCYNVSRCC